MLSRSVILMCLFGLLGCEQEGTFNEPSSLSKLDEGALSSRESLDPAVLAKWQTSCALCHIDGNGGAPRIQEPDDWTTRSSKSRDQLLQSTIEGLNNMPPLGYCMSCEETDFLAMIDFMIGDNR